MQLCFITDTMSPRLGELEGGREGIEDHGGGGGARGMEGGG